MKLNFIKSFLTSLFLIFLSHSSSAQDVSKDFIDMMREGGKIYVVYLILGVIVIGIFIYLLLLERKVAKIEKEIKK